MWIYYLLGSIGFLSVVRACLPLNLWRILLILWSLIGFFGTAIILQKYIEITTLTSNSLPIYFILMLLFTITFIVVTHRQNEREQNL